jgi:hypothetical protein
MSDQSAEAIAAGLTEALAQFDKIGAECPVKRNPRWQRDRVCSKCGAAALDGCLPQHIAAYVVVATVRKLLERNPQS